MALLASSRDTQNGPDWKDIQSTLYELESDYECRIDLMTHIVRRRGEVELMVSAVAHPWVSVNGDLRRSVSLNATLDRPGCGLGVAVIFRLLHTLAYEMGKAWQSESQIP